MDGAWALYEAWVQLQAGQADTALVYAFGKSSLGDLPDVLAPQLDPYCVAPLWPDAVSLAALQARAWLDSGQERARPRRGRGPRAPRREGEPERHDRGRLRGRDAARRAVRRRAAARARLPADLRRRGRRRARGGRSRAQGVQAPGVDPRHRSPHRAARLGVRDLTRSASTRIAAEKAGVGKARRRRRRAARAVHAPGAHPARRARAR